MNAVLNSIFKYLTPDEAKLKAYGFKEIDGKLYLEREIVDGQMSLKICVDGVKISTQVFDKATEEEFTLFLVPDAQGAFIGSVRADYEKVLRDIAANCFYRDIFKQDTSKTCIEFIRSTYGDELEFLWDNPSDAAIWRRKDNQKWYGLLMIVKRNRLGLEGDEPIEIIDVRVDPDKIDSIVDNRRYFHGYHMNKKHWLTILLDGSVAFDEIKEHIAASYALAKKK